MKIANMFKALMGTKVCLITVFVITDIGRGIVQQ